MRRLVLFVCLIAPGCADNRMFTDLGNGTAVPSESIGAYAAQHGLTRQQAKRELLIKAEEQKAAKAAAKAHEQQLDLGPSVTP